MDWEQVEAHLRRCASEVGRPTRRRIAGSNFLTSDVVATREVAGHLVELSYGRGFLGDDWLVGVSVRPDPDGLSRCVHGVDELPAVLGEVVSSLTGGE